MNEWVIDASIAISWVHPQQSTVETQNLLAQLDAGARMVVPVLWFTEVANVLLVLQRRSRITRVERLHAIEWLERLTLFTDDVSVRAAFSDASTLAEKHGLSVYDATYLEIAIRRSSALATRDEPLRKAAQAEGVPILS